MLKVEVLVPDGPEHDPRDCETVEDGSGIVVVVVVEVVVVVDVVVMVGGKVVVVVVVVVEFSAHLQVLNSSRVVSASSSVIPDKNCSSDSLTLIIEYEQFPPTTRYFVNNVVGTVVIDVLVDVDVLEVVDVDVLEVVDVLVDVDVLEVVDVDVLEVVDVLFDVELL